jgi:DNA-binding SARP family transcriptional activator
VKSQTPEPLIKIYLFGTFEVVLNGKKLDDKLWQSRQVRALLKALAAKRGTVITSEQLINMLWPKDDPEVALKSLYVRISQLRKLLVSGSEFQPVQSVPGGYLFVQPGDEQALVWVDVNAFETAADQGSDRMEQKQLNDAVEALEQARQLYRGDYMAEDLYAEWTIAERERLKERYLVVLTELAETYAQQGFFRRSINLCQQILSLDPWREAAFLRLMLYYYFSGDKSKAMQTYDQCQRVLQDQIGVTPDVHTIWIANCIQEGSLWSQPGVTAYPPPAYEGRMFEVPYSLGDPPFTGRDRDLAWMLDHWRQGLTNCLWISGEAGIGKTRLADAFCFAVEKAGADVHRLAIGRTGNDLCTDLIKVMDVSEPIAERQDLSPETKVLLSHWLDYEPRPIFDESRFEPKWVRGRIMADALLELMQASSAPVLLCIDDAHQLDEFSLEIIAEMIGKVGLLMTSRVGEENTAHLFLRLDEKLRSIIHNRTLNPWGLDDVQGLLTNLGGEAVLNVAERLHSRSQGNPLFVIASLQHLFEQGLLYVMPDGRWAQSGPFEGAIAPSIEATIIQRVKLVQPQDRLVLDVLAVAGGAMDYEILQVVSEMDEHTLLTLADQLISKGLIVEPRDLKSADITLAHGLYGDVLYQSLPNARRRIYHRRIAEAMLVAGRDTPPHASSLAEHFYKGGEVLKGGQYARIAGDYALQLYAPKAALRHYQDALDWIDKLNFDEKAEFRAEVFLGMAEAERYCGHYDQAEVYYQRSLPVLTGAFKEAAVFQLFNLQILQGKPLHIYDDLTEPYEGLLKTEGDTWALALYYWSKSFVALLRGDAKATRLQQVRGWRVARRLCKRGVQPPEWIIQRAYSIMMRAHNQWGNYLTSIHFAGKILSLTSASGLSSNTQAVVSASLGDSFTYLGKYAQVQEEYQTCYELAKSAGDPRLQGVALLGLGNLSFLRGEFGEAEDYAQQILCMANPPADIVRQMTAQHLLVRIAIKTRVDAQHFAILENILNFALYMGAQPECVQAELTLAEMAFLIQDLAQAEDYAHSAAQAAQKSHLQREACVAQRILAETSARRNDPVTALALAEDALALARTIQAPYEIGLCLRTRASLQTDPHMAVDDAKCALRIFEDLGAAYEAAQTLELISIWYLNGSGEETGVRPI